MTNFESFFGGRIFCVNLLKRTDRWRDCERQFAELGWTTVQRCPARIVNDEHGRPHGNSGCVASHRDLLDMQIKNQWPQMLVLEDDFHVIYHDFAERFDRFVADLPTTWDLLFLGAGLAEPPKSRVSKRVIRTNGLMTTSSYGITLAQARRMAPALSGGGPIDTLFQPFQRECECYLMDPVAVVQRPSYSDLQERDMDNSQSMLTRDLSSLV